MRIRTKAGRFAPPTRRALLFALSALAMGAPCCGGGLGGPASQLATLRVIGVTADKSYAAPGDTVSMRLTYADALGGPEDPPRKVQVTWLGGCVNPIGQSYVGCFAQFPTLFQGGALNLIKQSFVDPASSGDPDAQDDALVYPLPVAQDVLTTAEPTDTNTVYSTLYVFFAICAGDTKLASADSGASFPLECYDHDTGEQMSPDSYVVGYTQLFVFGDGRTNSNPPVMGMKFDDKEITDDPNAAPTVARCAPAAASGEAQGCGAPSATDCDSYPVEALVDDVAEVDPESSAEGGAPVKEAVWVDYFTDGGAFDGAKKLIHDPALGYRPAHGTKWTPPGEAGLYSLWAVIHDARGGSSVIRRFVRVE